MDTYVQTTLKKFDGLLRKYENWKLIAPSFAEQKLQQQVQDTLSKIENLDDSVFAQERMHCQNSVLSSISSAIAELKSQNESLKHAECLVAALEEKAALLESAFLAAEGVKIKEIELGEELREVTEAHKIAQKVAQDRIDEVKLSNEKQLAQDEEEQRAAWDAHQAAVIEYQKDRAYKLAQLKERRADQKASYLGKVREEINLRKAEFDRHLEEREKEVVHAEDLANGLTFELESLVEKLNDVELEKVRNKAYGMEKQRQVQAYELAEAAHKAEIERLCAELRRTQELLRIQNQEIASMQQVLNDQMAHKTKMASQVMAGTRVSQETVQQ